MVVVFALGLGWLTFRAPIRLICMEIQEFCSPDGVQNEVLRERAQVGGRGQCTRQYVVIEHETEIGLLVMDLFPDKAYAFLYEVFVLKEYRLRGIGGRILDTAEKLARKNGYRELYVDVVPLDSDYSQDRLVKWYEQRGYKPRSHRPNEMAKELASTT